MSLSPSIAPADAPGRPAVPAVPVLTLAGIQKSFAGVRARATGAHELNGGEPTPQIGEKGARK